MRKCPYFFLKKPRFQKFEEKNSKYLLQVACRRFSACLLQFLGGFWRVCWEDWQNRQKPSPALGSHHRERSSGQGAISGKFKILIFGNFRKFKFLTKFSTLPGFLATTTKEARSLGRNGERSELSKEESRFSNVPSNKAPNRGRRLTKSKFSISEKWLKFQIEIRFQKIFFCGNLNPFQCPMKKSHGNFISSFLMKNKRIYVQKEGSK